MSSTDLRDRFSALQAETTGWFDAAKAADGNWLDVDGLDGDEQARYDQVEQRGRELDDLRIQIVEMEKREAEWHEIERRAALALPEPPRSRSPIPATPDMSRSQHLQTRPEIRGLASDMLSNEAFLSHRIYRRPMELRALFGTGRITGVGPGYPPESVRTGEVADMALGPQDPLDMIPQIPTTQEVIVYMEETTQTRAATRVLEAGTYPEAAFAFTERRVPVSKIGAFLPVTDESMNSPEFTASEIEMRLANAVRRNAVNLMVTGTVVTNHWTGLAGYTRGSDRAQPGTGEIGLVNRGSDGYVDAILSAITRVRVYGDAMADGLLVNPLDWERIRSERTADGMYVLGSPQTYRGANPWGLSVMESVDVPEGTAYVGAWSTWARIHDRQELEVKMTDSHASEFTSGRVTLRADVRFAFYLLRPSSFFGIDFNA